MTTYTVKQLATMANISARTLRHYDAIGLLKPAMIGDNDYRYYGKEELLKLQQILLFKESGLSLTTIKATLDSNEFNQIHTLQSHKHRIRQEIDRLNQLLACIDRTTQHLIDDMPMDDFRLYQGFKHPTQRQLEKALVDAIGPSAQVIIDHQREYAKNTSKEDYQQHIKDMEKLCQAFAALINDEVDPESDKAQVLVKRFYNTCVKRITSSVPKTDWIKFLKYEMQDPSRQARYDSVHPQFAAYFLTAVIHYCDTHPDE